MNEPSLRTSRRALAGGLVAALLLGGGGFLLGRSTSDRQTVVPAPAPLTAPSPGPESDSGRRVLNRADLIALAAAAGDAAAARRTAPPEILAADGRRFELRLPFGCNGPATGGNEAPMRWRYDEDDEVLRIHAAPVAWTTKDWWDADEPAGIEAIGGFWIMRPWTSSETCPSVTGPTAAAGIDAVTLPGQALAVAQFFTREGARQGRRDGQPFETVSRIAPDAFRPSDGFRLLLSGRITSVPGGGPVLCRQPGGPEQRPICVIAVTIDEVAIENPASGDALAAWHLDRKDPIDR